MPSTRSRLRCHARAEQGGHVLAAAVDSILLLPVAGISAPRVSALGWVLLAVGPVALRHRDIG